MTVMTHVELAQNDICSRPSVYRDSVTVAAHHFGEKPVFCFAPEVLAQQAQLFLTHFPGEVSYAVKANPSDHVIETLYKSGIKVFDVASVVEMESVARLCGPVEFHYHNPVKSRAEIATAFHTFACRRFAADSVEEISKISQITGPHTGVEIAIRFRLPKQGMSAHDFSSKFGVDEAGAANLMKMAVSLGFEPILTFHPGSQCTDPAAWASHIEAASRIAKNAGIELKRLNVGGGFPSTYTGSQGPCLQDYFKVISDSLLAEFGQNAPELECEPGRALCAGSTSLLTRVKLVRSATGDVFLNDGIYGGLLEVAQAPALQPFIRVIRNGFLLETSDKTGFTVFGPTCDPLDVLPHKLALPFDIQEDDIIEFAGIGAYGTATSTRFNGYGSADVVMVSEAFVGE